MAGDRRRIEEIKKRREQRDKALKRKIYMIRRAILILIALGIILAIIMSIRGCVNAQRQRREEEAARIAAEEAAKPTPTPPPVINEKGINETFYGNCAFFGNSFIEGMTVYDFAPGIDYYSKVGLTVSQAFTDATDMGTVPAVEEFKTSKQYDRIFLMFGENEVGWIGDAFFEQYEELANTIQGYQPNAKLYLLAITPISREVSEQNIDSLNIEQVKAYNSGIKTVADNVGAQYADIFTPLVSKDGYLDPKAASDGIHFDEDYYIKALKYIQENYE